MSTINDSDLLLVERNGNLHQITYDQMSTLNDDDILLVERGGVQYKVEAQYVSTGANGLIIPPVEVLTPLDRAGDPELTYLKSDTILAVEDDGGSFAFETDTINSVGIIDTSSYELKAHSISATLNTLTWDSADLGPATIASGVKPATGWGTAYWAFIKFNGPAKLNWGPPNSGSTKTVSYFYSHDGINWVFDSYYNQSPGSFSGPFSDSVNSAIYWAMGYTAGTNNPLSVDSVTTITLNPDTWYQYTMRAAYT